MNHSPNRRSFLAALATAVLLVAVTWVGSSQSGVGDVPKPADPVAFFLIGDTHLFADTKNPDVLDERSAAYSSKLVDTLNKLPGTEIAKPAGGGSVRPVRGVIHAGDCIETGEPAKVKMQETEWGAFAKTFGLTGADGRLKFPLYEVHGNHDATRDKGVPIQQIIERNKTRPGVTNVSKNGLHYSWDWGPVHFINLGIIVGGDGNVKRKRRYDPLGSLEFLIADLKDKVGDSGRPVVITHHVDMLRYAQPLPVDDKKAEAMEWDPADVKAFYDAVKDFNVAAILYGHTHARNVFRWNGSAAAGKTGIPVFNVSKSSHYSGKGQAFFYMEIADGNVTAREYQTKDGWETGAWTPQMWSAEFSKRP